MKENKLINYIINEIEEDDNYHCSNLSEKELKTKTKDRSYYLELKDNNAINTIIYVDKHDYLLYMRPLWREWKKIQLEKRCLIPSKRNDKYKYCSNSCEQCHYFKSNKNVSLDDLKENTNYEVFDELSDSKELLLFNEAKKMLWDLIKTFSSNEQYQKIILYFKNNLSFSQIGKIYGVSHKAIEKTIKKVLIKVKNEIDDEEKSFLYHYLSK